MTFFLTFYSFQLSYATGFPTLDISNLAQNILQAFRMVESIQKLVQQIQNQKAQIQNQLQSLKRLDFHSFNSIRNYLNSNINRLNGLLGNVNGIGYTYSNIQSQFDTLFPPGTNWANIPWSNYNQYYRDWNNQIQDAARISMHSQGAINDIRFNNQRAMEIMNQSRVADGEVRQLQSTNQMLGVLNNQLSNLNGLTATGNRLTASIGAKAAANSEIKRQAKQGLTDGYTDKGSPAAKHNSFPRTKKTN